MKKFCIVLFAVVSLFLTTGLRAESSLTVAEILRRVDANYQTTGRISTTRLIVRSSQGKREMVAKSSIQGLDAYTEYLSPARDAGTKMLKRGDKLWIYTPSTDRTISIAGQLLRQSMMGSDFSYEDYMNDLELSNAYSGKVVGHETVSDRRCLLLELTALPGKDVAYHSRKLWVDEERFLPLRQELFARSGTPLKSFIMEEVQRSGSRWYAKRMTVRDLLKKEGGTTIVVESIEFDAKIPVHVFSKAALRR